MISTEEIVEIRKMFHVEQWSVVKISMRTGIAQEEVGKIINTDKVFFDAPASPQLDLFDDTINVLG